MNRKETMLPRVKTTLTVSGSNRDTYMDFRIIIHFIAAVTFWFALYYDYNHVRIPEQIHRMGNNFGGKFKFLTFLDAIIQAVYFTISLVNDFLGSNEVSPIQVPLIRKIKDYLMASLAFPVAMNVGISFWSLMAIDRELVFPKAFDAFFPGWLNHIMHTNIMIFIILELFISFRAYPKRRKGLLGLTVFMISYLIWIHVIKYYSGVWVYPVLDVLNFPLRLAFFVLILAITLSLYILGEFLNSRIWAKELKQLSKKSN
ncbi:androgen-induced gene 1 protein-like isoform X1 [Hermetia illucens]|nr:androgen-induced gene 1 protein-like isoform X1 [Hermetia illucens]